MARQLDALLWQNYNWKIIVSNVEILRFRSKLQDLNTEWPNLYSTGFENDHGRPPFFQKKSVVTDIGGNIALGNDECNGMYYQGGEGKCISFLDGGPVTVTSDPTFSPIKNLPDGTKRKQQQNEDTEEKRILITIEMIFMAHRVMVGQTWRGVPNFGDTKRWMKHCDEILTINALKIWNKV